MDLKSTYNKIAEDWFKDHSDDSWWKEGTEKFLSGLKPGASILDVGCGAGHKSRYLDAKGFKVTGADFSEKMIDIAKRESPHIKYYVVDIYEIDKYPKGFDAIFAQAVLLHIPKDRIKEVIKKLIDKINSGGYLYVAVKAKRENSKAEEIKTENDYGYDYSRFFSYYEPKELEKYLADVGMTVIWQSSIVAGNTTWLQIVGKKL